MSLMFKRPLPDMAQMYAAQPLHPLKPLQVSRCGCRSFKALPSLHGSLYTCLVVKRTHKHAPHQDSYVTCDVVFSDGSSSLREGARVLHRLQNPLDNPRANFLASSCYLSLKAPSSQHACIVISGLTNDEAPENARNTWCITFVKINSLWTSIVYLRGDNEHSNLHKMRWQNIHRSYAWDIVGKVGKDSVGGFKRHCLRYVFGKKWKTLKDNACPRLYLRRYI